MKSKRYDIDEPDLKPITNCINGKIEITPEICKKFWDYRADSGHLWHLLFDLIGEDFVTTHRQDESIRKVLEEWDAHSNAIERDKVLPILEALVKAFYQYEMDVMDPEFSTPYIHRNMMEKAENLIKELRTPTPEAHR